MGGNPFRLHGEALATSVVYRYALVVLVPALLVIFIAAGFPSYVIEDQVNELWVPKDSDYAASSAYKDTHGEGASSTQFLISARPRDGTSTVVTADALLEHNARMNLVYDTTTTVDGVQYSLADVCQNPSGAYVFPCLKITVLDCFYEGGSGQNLLPAALGTAPTSGWRAQALSAPGTVPGLTDAGFENYLFAGLAGSSCAAGVNFTSVGGPVLSTCSAAVAQGLAAPDLTCQLCFGTLNATMSAAQKAGVVLATVTAGLNQMTPYSSKPRLLAADGTKLSPSAVAAAINAPCYQWESGAVFGTINKLLVLGEQTKAADGTITSVGAYEAILPLNAGAAIVSRVASAASVFSVRGGPITISVAQAEKVLRALKAALEESAVQASTQTGLWDDEATDAGDSLIHTAFTDDSVVHGTFANVLIDNTTKSSTLMIVNYVVVMVLAALAFANCSNYVSSRSTVGLLGVGLAILGFLAALGFAAMIDIKWNIITLWTLPFLIVGIGVDDMFIIHLAVDKEWSNSKGKEPKQVLGDTLADVLAPVTLTSLTNFFMFLVMARSDLAGIYDTAYVAMIAIVMMWVTTVTSLPALIAIDLARQSDNRGELCCLCAPVEQKAEQEAQASIAALMSKSVEPAHHSSITSTMGKITIAVLSVAAIIFCGVKMGDLPLGLELNDFFVTDTWQAQYFLDRTQYFPFWPINMNFGSVDYHTPLAQLGMLKYWENTMVSDSISGPSTSGFVWTAAMAAWGHSDICDASTNPLITACGPAVSTTCTAKWYPNIYGSKLSTEGGVCADFSALPFLATFGGDMYAAFSFVNQIHTSAIGENATDAAILGDGLFPTMLGMGVQQLTAAALAVAPCNASAAASNVCVGTTIAGMSTDAQVATARATYAVAYRADSLYTPMLDAGLSATACAASTSNATLLATCLTNTKGAMDDWQKDATVKATYSNLPATHPANLGSFQPSGYTEFCPVFDLSQDDFDTCVDLWHANDNSYSLISPGIKSDPAGGLSSNVQYSQVGGSSTYAINLHTTEDYLSMIRKSRKECDTATTLKPTKTGAYDVELAPIQCFMSGIPFDYWEQYLTIEDFLFETIGFAVLAAVCVAVLFLVLELILSGRASSAFEAVQAAFVGAIIIACTIAISVITVVGFMGWLDVPLSGLTAMSSLMTVGFASEFAVHITHGFLVSTEDTAAGRIKATMEKLFLPTLLAFLSTLIGIMLLVASDFGFVTNYVFKPLIVCIVVTYLYGVWTLPVLLQCLDFMIPQLVAADGKKEEEPKKEEMTAVAP